MLITSVVVSSVSQWNLYPSVGYPLVACSTRHAASRRWIWLLHWANERERELMSERAKTLIESSKRRSTATKIRRRIRRRPAFLSVVRSRCVAFDGTSQPSDRRPSSRSNSTARSMRENGCQHSTKRCCCHQPAAIIQSTLANKQSLKAFAGLVLVW